MLTLIERDGGGWGVDVSVRGVQQEYKLDPFCHSAGSLTILQQFRAKSNWEFSSQKIKSKIKINHAQQDLVENSSFEGTICQVFAPAAFWQGWTRIVEVSGETVKNPGAL